MSGLDRHDAVALSGPLHDPTAPVIDLESSPAVTRTRVTLERDLSPFDRLAADDRKRLLVRVLCELVAYEPPDAAPHRLAG